MKFTLKVLALGAAITASATMAKAQYTYNGATDLAPTGSVVATTGMSNYTPPGAAWTIDYTETVFQGQNGSTDSLCVGCLTFYISVQNLSTSSDSLASISTGALGVPSQGEGFLYFTDDAYYLNSTTGPTSNSFDPSVGTITYDYATNGEAPALAPGETATLIIETDATGYIAGNIGINDNVAVNVNGFVPAATPEPSSLALLGTSLLGAAGIARRRFLRK